MEEEEEDKEEKTEDKRRKKWERRRRMKGKRRNGEEDEDEDRESQKWERLGLCNVTLPRRELGTKGTWRECGCLENMVLRKESGQGLSVGNGVCRGKR